MKKMTNNEMVKANGGKWHCSKCGWKEDIKDFMTAHIKSKHKNDFFVFAYWVPFV